MTECSEDNINQLWKIGPYLFSNTLAWMLLGPQIDVLYYITFTEQMANRTDFNLFLFNKKKYIEGVACRFSYHTHGRL